MLNAPGTTNGLAFQSVTINMTDPALFQEMYSKNTLAVWSEVRAHLLFGKNQELHTAIDIHPLT